VVAAFHHVPAALYHQHDNDLVVDVLVAANASEDFAELQSVTSGASSLNLWHAGDLTASATLERLTPMMLNLNTRYDMMSSTRIVDYRQRVIDLSATVEV
jgi:predicted dinucleotide-binding enzyme